MIFFFLLVVAMALLVGSQITPVPTPPTTPGPTPTKAPASPSAVSNASELAGLFALYDGIGMQLKDVSFA